MMREKTTTTWWRAGVFALAMACVFAGEVHGQTTPVANGKSLLNIRLAGDVAGTVVVASGNPFDQVFTCPGECRVSVVGGADVVISVLIEPGITFQGFGGPTDTLFCPGSPCAAQLSDGEESILTATFAAQPLCEVAVSSASYTDGETVTLQDLRIANTGTSLLPLEIGLALSAPGGTVRELLDVGADGSFQTLPGLDRNFGPVPLFQVNPAMERGFYQISCLMRNPVTFQILAADDTFFELQ